MSLEKISPELPKGRFQKVKAARQEAIEKIKENNKVPDRGRIRQQAVRLIETADKNLPAEEQEAITDRLIHRHLSEYRIGSQLGCIDGMHSITPKEGEVVRRMRLQFPEINSEEAFQLFQKVKSMAISASSLGTAEERMKKAPTDFNNQFPAGSPERFIAEQFRKFDAGTDKIVKEAITNFDVSSFQARLSRLRNDLNKNSNIRPKGVEEYGLLGQKAISAFLKKTIEANSQFNEEGKVAQPFLHISVHAAKRDSGNAGDLIIANFSIEGQMAADPAIARWFKEKLNEKIKAFGIKNEDGEFFRAGIALERMRLSGTAANIERRYGGKDIQPLGELYQHIQLEITPQLRVEHGSQLGQILGNLLEEFHQTFPDKRAYQKFIKKERTPIDKDRLAGILNFDELAQSAEVNKKAIALSGRYRKALGVVPKEEKEKIKTEAKTEAEKKRADELKDKVQLTIIDSKSNAIKEKIILTVIETNEEQLEKGIPTVSAELSLKGRIKIKKH